MRLLILSLIAVAGLPQRSVSADLRVGAPEFPTIALAIKLAKPGDTIHLEPGQVYRDYAGFYGKKGEPGRPIVLDGHGATLEGSDPIEPAQWKQAGPDLYFHDSLLPRIDGAVLGRWFFLFDGKKQLMGRTSKGIQTPLKRPEELQPGEWTFVRDPGRSAPDQPGVIFGAFYLKLAQDQSLADAKISAPVRSAGVQMSGDNAHLIIRNLTATHPYNDGFNIHGDCRDVFFENIRAIDCGDDGISAHETAEYRVDGFISIGNSTGICDTVAAKTSYRRVFIADCAGYDLFFLDDGRYRIEDALVLSSAQNPFTVTGREDRHCVLEIENLLFRRVGPPKPALIAKTAEIRASRLNMEGIEWDNRGQFTVLDPGIGADFSAIWEAFGPEMRAFISTRYGYPPGSRK